MKCPNCENYIEENSVSCEWCGINVQTFEANQQAETLRLAKEKEEKNLQKAKKQTQQQKFPAETKTTQGNKSLNWLIIGCIVAFYILSIIAFFTEVMVFYYDFIYYYHYNGSLTLISAIGLSAIICAIIVMLYYKKLSMPFGISAILLCVYMGLFCWIFGLRSSLLLYIVLFLAILTMLIYKFAFASKKK